MDNREGLFHRSMTSQWPEDTRKAYWAAQMDEAFAFMEEMRQYPLEECGEPFAPLKESLAGVEVAFSSTLRNNQFPRVYWIRSGLLARFLSAAREMNESGWILKVEDAYRSPEMQRAQSHNPRHFDLILQKTIWEQGGEIPSADLMLRRMSALIATRCRVGTHISGSAIDISVLDRDTGKELDRGGGYIEISERTPFESPFIDEKQRANRHAIDGIMRRHGWVPYPYEFWHYSAGDSYAECLSQSGRPAHYGAVRFDGAKITPLSEPESDALLEPVEFYKENIAAALERLGDQAKQTAAL